MCKQVRRKKFNEDVYFCCRTMRRGVGIGAINQQLLEKKKFEEKGSELARDHLEKVNIFFLEFV